MAEYIEKETLLRSLRELGYSCCDYWPGIRDVILTEIAADVVPVVRGRWVYEKTYQGMKYVCSECGEIPECFEPNYCPNCGANMKDGE